MGYITVNPEFHYGKPWVTLRQTMNRIAGDEAAFRG